MLQKEEIKNVVINENIPPQKEEIKEEPQKEEPLEEIKPFTPSSKGSTIEKIASDWSEIVNRSIKEGLITVYFAINNTIAFPDGQFLIIKARDEEGREKIINNKDRIKEYILKLYNTNVEIKTQTSEVKMQNADKNDVFDKFDELSKKFPQNFNQGDI